MEASAGRRVGCGERGPRAGLRGRRAAGRGGRKGAGRRARGRGAPGAAPCAATHLSCLSGKPGVVARFVPKKCALANADGPTRTRCWGSCQRRTTSRGACRGWPTRWKGPTSSSARGCCCRRCTSSRARTTFCFSTSRRLFDMLSDGDSLAGALVFLHIDLDHRLRCGNALNKV